MTTTHIDIEDASIPEAAFVAAILGTNPGRVKSDELRKHLAADHGTRTIGGSVMARPDPLAAIPAEHRERFAELSFKAAKGDKRADAELTQLEAKISAAAAQILRQVGAESEAHRLAVAAEEKKAEAERERKVKHHAHLVQQREGAFSDIEAATEKLAAAVKSALAVDQEVWGAAIACGFPQERRTSSRIVNFISTALGREGAGLGDMPSVYGALRESLTCGPASS